LSKFYYDHCVPETGSVSAFRGTGYKRRAHCIGFLAAWSKSNYPFHLIAETEPISVALVNSGNR
jgi:hypothetical protein